MKVNVMMVGKLNHSLQGSKVNYYQLITDYNLLQKQENRVYLFEWLSPEKQTKTIDWSSQLS